MVRSPVFAASLCSLTLSTAEILYLREARIPQKGYCALPDSRLRHDETLVHPLRRAAAILHISPGWPGVWLLILRCSIAIALHFENGFSHPVLPTWIQALAILLSITLFLGCLTPIVAAICLFFHALIWCLLGVGSTAFAIIICLDLIALGLLGPGGYSVDAFRFGRRVIVLPPP
jgi:hypothetical protein